MLPNLNSARFFTGKTNNVILQVSLIIFVFFTTNISTAQAETITGTFQMMTGDPSPETGLQPIFIYNLIDDAGKTTQLQFDRNVLEQAGGISAINGKRVSVSGHKATTGATSFENTSDSSVIPETLEVDSITIEEDILFLPDASDSQPISELSGPQPWASILCRFADYTTTPVPREKAYFEGLMGEEEPGMGHYWPTTSYGNMNISGSEVHGWYDLPENRAAYFDTNNRIIWSKAANDCANAADADVDFNNFVGVNFFFNYMGGSAWGGGTNLTADNAGYKRATWMPNWAYTTHPGVIAHEMGHGFGLPHSSGPYSATYDSKWDPMSASYSNWNCPNRHIDYQCISVHTITAHKDKLNWIAPDRIYTAESGTTQSITLERLAQPGPNGYLMVKIPISSTVFYTVEARKAIGYDRNIPGEAIVIHKVDPYNGRWAQVVDASLNYNPNDEGAMWKPGETFHDPDTGITLSVDSETTTGFNITVTGVTPWNYLAEATPYDWIDATGGIKIMSGNHINYSPGYTNIGFNFKFYGHQFNRFLISSNGALTFDPFFLKSNIIQSLPTSLLPNALVAPLWAPLDKTVVYSLQEGTAPNRRTTISWEGPAINQGIEDTLQFQATFYEANSEIVFRYKKVNTNDVTFSNGAGASVGLEDLLGKSATQYSYKEASLENETAIRFYRELDNYPPVIASITDKTVYETKQLTVNVSASDPDGIPPILSANLNGLPADNNASFTDNGDGTGQFFWTPSSEDEVRSPYSISLTATDAEDSSVKVVQSFQINVKRKNLLKYGSFDKGISSWLLDGATRSGGSRTSPYALLMIGDPTRYYPKASQKVDVIEGNNYRFSGWIKVNNRSTGRYIFQVRWFNGTTEINGTRTTFGITETNTSYSEQTIDIVAPTGATQSMIVLQANKANGNAYYDDISIIDLTEFGTTDTQAPTIPQNLKAKPIGSTQITLTWHSSQDLGGGNVAGYHIYRDGNSVPIATIIGRNGPFNDTGLTPSTTYFYTVSAFDDASPANESKESIKATTTTLPTSANLLLSPGFETPIIINTWHGVAPYGTILYSSGNSHTGERALSIEGKATGYPYKRQRITVTPNNTYRFSGWIKTVGMTTGKYIFQVRWHLNTGQEINGTRTTFGATSTNTSYTKHTIDLVAPANAYSSYIVLQSNKGDGFAYYDDMSIINVSEGETDTQPPTVPQNLNATAASSSQINLSWDASTDNGGGTVAGYKIFRDSNSTPIATVTDGTSYNDTGLTADTTYDYTVLAFDDANPTNASAKSTIASATTSPLIDVDPPTVPINLSATATSAKQINLSWDASTDIGGGTVAGYKIFRDGNSTPIATVTDGTTYSDTGLTANTTYVYTVSAFDNASPTNESVVSSQASATTLPVSTNLLLNGDFELGNTNSWVTNGADANLGNAKTGKYALAIKGNPSGYPKASQKVPVTAGKTYRFYGWMEVVGLTKGKYIFQVRWFSASGAELGGTRTSFGIMETNTAYNDLGVDLVAPAGAAKAMLLAQANKADGTAYYDDLSIINLD